LFFTGAESCEVSYADRKGKYMGQKGITCPSV
ncbi:MAG TPA: dCTP deaminase, partial [Chlamydiales bacterium]